MAPVAFVLTLLLQVSLLPMQAFASGAPVTSQVPDSVGSSTNVYLNGQTLREGATLADGTVVRVGTSALLTPGVGDREIRTTYTPDVVYQAGSAVAPEGWTLYYSTDYGTNWQLNEPVPASTVTDIKAVATNVAAGLISGLSQGYSTETTAAVPASTFNASSDGDGWGATLLDNYVFNVYHHNDHVGLDCHLKSDSSSCYGDGQPVRIVGPDGEDYGTGARSNPIADAQHGRLYLFVVPTGGQQAYRAGVLCIDVQNPSAPFNCGFTPLGFTDSNSWWSNDWYAAAPLSQLVRSGTKYFAMSSVDNLMLCFDSATQAACASNGAQILGGSTGDPSRILLIGAKLFVLSSGAISCLNVSDLTDCSGGNWPLPTFGYVDVLGQFVPHESTSGITDGICVREGCITLDGEFAPNFSNPVSILDAYVDYWQDSLVINHRAYMYLRGASAVGCWDYLTDSTCDNFFEDGYWMASGGPQFAYQLAADPENSNCIWFNSDDGILGNFDATTGFSGCTENPVLTLQPSQFAPRYACSTSNGITSWDTLRISNIVGGGTAGSISLTVRDADGNAVAGWSNVPVTLNSDLDMSGLDVALSGSRPTFSFKFSNVVGTISSATIALDYKGKGPEICSSVALNSNGQPMPFATGIYGSLNDAVAADTFDSIRNFSIDTVDGTSLFLGAPSAPRNLVGTGLNTSANLTFEPPLDSGGSDVTGYRYSLDGGSSWLTPAETLDNGDGSYTIPLTGLTPGQTYNFAVLAVNSIGRGLSTSITTTVQLVEPGNIPDTAVDQGPIYLATVNSNNLPYTYTVSPSDVCSVVANVITLLDQGLCTVTTEQAGDDTHIATSDTSSFTVLPASVPKTVPGVIQNLEGGGADGQISFDWQAPASDGNSPIFDYVIQYKVGNTYVPLVDGVSTATGARITGLQNGTTYLVRIAARNAIGLGAFSTPEPYTPSTVPGQPTSLSVSVTGNTAILSWVLPTSDGGAPLTAFNIYYKLRTSPVWLYAYSVPGDSSSFVYGGLDGVSDYDFYVEAQNSNGVGAAVSTVDLHATVGDGQVDLAWEAPLSGSPSNYIVNYREDGTNTWNALDMQSTATAMTLSGLANGTQYEFRIVAMADATTVQSYSSSIYATPLGSATAPTLTTVAGIGQVTLAWSGANGNGSGIYDYIVHYRVSGSNVWRTANDGVGANSELTIPGLANGTLYEFEVAAVNGVGTGTYSAIGSATPRKTPGAPSVANITTTHTTAEISWNDPVDDGGAAISSYNVFFKERSAGSWTAYTGTEFTGASVIIRNLTANTAYSFKIAAVNEAGAGTFSAAAASSTQGYTIRFLSAGAGSGSAPSTTTGGGRFTLPDNTGSMTKAGFSFVGWIINGVSYTVGQQVTITKNTNIFARWLRCAMTYVAPTKTSGSVPSSRSGCTNRIVRANVGNLKRTGYYFTGWSVNGVFYRPGEIISVDGVYTAIAQWARFTITYMAARATGGEVPAPTLGYGETALSSDPGTLVRDGYHFGGWVLGNTAYQAGDTIQLRGNVKAFARWIKNSRR